MLASELAARANKLEREHREREEKARRAREKERILQERHRQREAEAEARRRERLAALELAREAEEARAQQLRERNGGCYLRLVLQAAPAQDEQERAQRGLRRSADKILLPPSAGRALMDQGVMWSGSANTFELAAASTGARTHAGLLDFTAPEGVVMIPRKVAECLWGPFGGGGAEGDGDRSSYPQCVSGAVTVTFKRLQHQGEYCRLQPALRSFHEHVRRLDEEQQEQSAAAEAEGPQQQPHGGAMHAALEAALSRLTVLSEGDWVRAELPGLPPGQEGEQQQQQGGGGSDGGNNPSTTTEYLLRVVELRPGAAVSILDTDLATDVGPSIETEGYLRAEQERRARDEERARQAMEREAAEAEVAARASADAAARRAASALRRRAECEARLPSEPPAEAEVVTCALRLPRTGERAQRRFALNCALAALFDWAESLGAAEQAGGGEDDGALEQQQEKQEGQQPPPRRSFALVTQFPRRVLRDSEGSGGGGSGGGGSSGSPPKATTLRDCGFSAGEQVALMVESL